jgi:hypothetical protein
MRLPAPATMLPLARPAYPAELVGAAGSVAWQAMRHS